MTPAFMPIPEPSAPTDIGLSWDSEFFCECRDDCEPVSFRRYVGSFVYSSWFDLSLSDLKKPSRPFPPELALVFESEGIL